MEGTVRSIETTAPPEVVFEVAADLASYPEWASGVKTVEILEQDEEGRPVRVHFVVEGWIKRIACDLRYRHDPPHRLEWTAIPGEDIEEMDGYYEFRELEGGGTEVVYALRVEPAFTIPGFLRRQAEKQVVGTALRQLKRRAERLAETKG
ncbi:MAG: SRPBCC family protein [Acidimicrobiia bacterium]